MNKSSAIRPRRLPETDNKQNIKKIEPTKPSVEKTNKISI